MKYSLIFLLFVTTTFNSFATIPSNLVVNANDGSKIVIELLDGELDESEAELLWEVGQEAIFVGNFCYNGSKEDAKKMIKLIGEMELLGDEFSIINIKTVDENSVGYDILDGPNDYIAQKVLVFDCRLTR